MVNKRNILKANRVARETSNFTRPEGAGNFENMDDNNVVRSVNLKFGTTQTVQDRGDSIANKDYVDNAVALPSGFIGAWSGTIATIPAGWILCDGNNGTPDLRDRFVIGANADVGGIPKAEIRGDPEQSCDIACHCHTDDGHSHFGAMCVCIDCEGSTSGCEAWDFCFDSQCSSASIGPEWHYPPCYALAFIMKT